MPDEPTSTGTIVVSGTGRVAVQPDVADLRLGVTVAKPPVGPFQAATKDVWKSFAPKVWGNGVYEKIQATK